MSNSPSLQNDRIAKVSLNPCIGNILISVNFSAICSGEFSNRAIAMTSGADDFSNARVAPSNTQSHAAAEHL